MEVKEINETNQVQNEENKTTRRKRTTRFIPKFGCLRLEEDYPTTPSTNGAGKSDGGVSLEMESDSHGDLCFPTHLVVMVNGIVGSAGNWKFAAKQFLIRHPHDVVVHCSECNSSMLTFDGVDIMGERLAEEVMSVISRRPRLEKISFIGHSLGGLIARYAIGRLYKENTTNESMEGNGYCTREGRGIPCVSDKSRGKIAGLEPMNFITFATPHLGSRGHKQVPGFCSLRILEKVARHTSWMLSRTGKHLFLTDSDNGKPPLLLQMVSDSGDLQFMSALHSFRHRAAYANARFDFIVGWSTSSIRRQNELPKHLRVSKNEKYPHIVNVESPITTSFEQEVPLKDRMKELKTSDMEELMIKGLTRVGWERVDVSFRRSKQRFFAHSTIQVKSYWINSDGADVIFHLIDNFLL